MRRSCSRTFVFWFLTLKTRSTFLSATIYEWNDKVSVSVQIVDPKLASYGVEHPIYAVIQLAQTTMRSELGKITLDKTFEERDTLNEKIVVLLFIYLFIYFLLHPFHHVFRFWEFWLCLLAVEQNLHLGKHFFFLFFFFFFFFFLEFCTAFYPDCLNENKWTILLISNILTGHFCRSLSM